MLTSFKVNESQKKQMVYTNQNAYKMCKNTCFVFLVISPYSHVCPFSHKCTTNVWLFKLLFSGISACPHVYAQIVALKTKEKRLKFQSRVLESPLIFALKDSTNPLTYFSGKQHYC